MPLKDDGTLDLQDASWDSPIPDATWDWEDTSGAITSETEPSNPILGAKWLKPVGPDDEPVLKVWNGRFWQGNAVDTTSVYKSPRKDMYVGYLTGDGRPPNGAPYTFGITFPTATPVEGQFHLRTDYFPNRLFRWNGTVWMKYEDNVRMTITNRYDPAVPNRSSTATVYTTDNRQTQRTGFINNNNTATIAGAVVPERQALSKILKPKADN
jgi:hypothetical protein